MAKRNRLPHDVGSPGCLQPRVQRADLVGLGDGDTFNRGRRWRRGRCFVALLTLAEAAAGGLLGLGASLQFDRPAGVFLDLTAFRMLEIRNGDWTLAGAGS